VISRLALLLLAGVLAALWLDSQAPFRQLVESAAAAAGAPVVVTVLAAAWWAALRPPRLVAYWVPALAGVWLAALPLGRYHALEIGTAGEGRIIAVARWISLPHARGADADGLVELATGQHLRLRWPNAPPVRLGERWRLLINLRTPPPMDNPGRASAALGYLRDRVHGRATVLSSRLNQRLDQTPPRVDGLRARVVDGIQARVVERDAAALFCALAVGDTQFVSPQRWRVFNAVGITHLVAISGLHVTLFSLVVAALARRLWRWLPPLADLVRRESFAASLGVAAALGYAVLSGFSVPAQRTVMMLAAWHVVRGAARPAAAAPPLAVALVVVLLLDPLAPLSAGFWLSFVAVGVLLCIRALEPGAALHAIRELWHTQWSVALGLMPVTVAVFGSVSLAGLLVNMVAIPFFSLLLVPLLLSATLALCWAPALASPLLAAAEWLHGRCWPTLTQIAEAPHALWRLSPSWWWFVLAAPAVVLMLFPWRGALRLTALYALLPALWPAGSRIAPGEFAATVLDTGRNLAVIVRTAHHTLLFDDGETWGSEGAISTAVVVPALRALGVVALSRAIVPRLDRDRAAGLVAIAAEMPLAGLQSAPREGLPPEFSACRRGSWQWDAVRFELLDEQSCALRVVAGHGASLLLAGDLSAAGQMRLIDAAELHSTAVLVPAHAAASAWVPALINATAARFAVVAQSASGVQTAAVSRTVAAWRAAGAEVLVTGERGAIDMRSDGARLRVHGRHAARPADKAS
jgi:competence protein ComEC